MTAGIVILNFLNNSVTDNTLQELLKQKNINKYHIAVVDNGSNNGSIEMLRGKYGDLDNVSVLSVSSNLGYAKGNDVGIRYLLKNGIENILIMNSDIMFVDKNGLENLFSGIPENVGVVGPNIIGKYGKPANPINISVGLKDTFIRVGYNNLRNIIPKIIKVRVKNNTNDKTTASPQSRLSNPDDNFFLHGGAYILTNDYFKNIPELYPKTFLYYEAQILKILTVKFDLKHYFNAKVKMEHLEDQSSDMAFGDNSKIKQKMVAKSQMVALKLYFKLMRPKKFIKDWKKNIENNKF